MFDRSLKILLVSPEVTPLAKVGGLADVAGSLPKAIATLGQGEISHDIRVAMPRYKGIEAREYVTDFPVEMEGRQETAIIRRTQIEAHLGPAHAVVPVYLIDNYHYFNRDGIYAHADDADRFIFFSKAVLEMLPRLGFQPDILHLNDWQTGATAFLLETRYRHNPFYERMATLFTIHNLQYQGNFDRQVLRKLGVGEEYFHPESLEFYGQVSLLKAGLVYSQILNTVSPTYAEEIKTPTYGERLDGLLRKRSSDLFGVLNGINYHEFNPETDPRIVRNYTSANIEAKKDNKSALQEELGLNVGDYPLFGIVSRLVSQKGLDLVTEVAPAIIEGGAQLAVLGTGDPHYEESFQQLAQRYPSQVGLRLGFNSVLAQRIYAGADLFLMPSRFEPCGLGQMIAMRYGTIPVVRATGGLADTVRDYDQNPLLGNGFVFSEYTARALLETIRRALRLYREKPEEWRVLVKRAMEIDHSWAKSAANYVELYQLALKRIRPLAETAD